MAECTKIPECTHVQGNARNRRNRISNPFVKTAGRARGLKKIAGRARIKGVKNIKR